MDGFGDAFRSSIREYVGLYEENQQLKKQMSGRMAAMEQNMNLCTISGPGGTPIYATGSKPGCADWSKIYLAPLQGEESPPPRCPIEDVSNVECRIGNRLFRFADAVRTEAECSYQDTIQAYIEFDYVFENFDYVVEYFGAADIHVRLRFYIDYEVVEGWAGGDHGNLRDLANPSNLRSDQLPTPVEFAFVSATRRA